MIASPDLDPKTCVAIRAKTLQTIRHYFDQHAFYEVDAPTLISANAVEAFIDPLETLVQEQITDQKERQYLMTSPEIYMKRLLARGLDRIYFLGHVFRDREKSPLHLCEFLMLEWYITHSDLQQVIAQCEDLFSKLAIAITGKDLFPVPFDQLSVASAWENYAQIDLLKCLAQIEAGDHHALQNAVKAKGEDLREDADFDDAFTHVMLKWIEPNIGQTNPCVLINWPKQTAALSALHPQNPLIAQRFEIYYRGVELANAFAELTCPIQQRERFIEANQTREKRSVSPHPIDEHFLRDLAQMPPSCGIAVGIDRLMLIISGQNDLRSLLPLHAYSSAAPFLPRS